MVLKRQTHIGDGFMNNWNFKSTKALVRLRQIYKQFVPHNIRERLWLMRQQSKCDFLPNGPDYADTSEEFMTRRLFHLKGAYAGHRCFIMGNGPSLNRMDLSLFAREYVWGSNRCYLLFDRIKWRPRFFVSVDTRVLPDIADDVNKQICELTSTSFFFPVIFRRKGLLDWARNVYWYKEVMPKDTGNACEMFSLNVEQQVSSVRTVTVAALQCAVYLGFNPIYLIGCDTSYTVPNSVNHEDDEKDKLTSTADDDCNHFDPSYFGKGRKWHEPHADRMIAHYKLVKEVCDPLGVRIYNATVGGELEVFPRVDYREVLAMSPWQSVKESLKRRVTDSKVIVKRWTGL